jgi:hypothetical protein
VRRQLNCLRLPVDAQRDGGGSRSAGRASVASSTSMAAIVR